LLFTSLFGRKKSLVPPGREGRPFAGKMAKLKVNQSLIRVGGGGEIGPREVQNRGPGTPDFDPPRRPISGPRIWQYSH